MRTGKLPKKLPRPSSNCIGFTLALLTVEGLFLYNQVKWTNFNTWHGMDVVAYHMDKFDGTAFTASAFIAQISLSIFGGHDGYSLFSVIVRHLKCIEICLSGILKRSK